MREFDVIVRKPSRRLRRKRNRDLYAAHQVERFIERLKKP